MKRLFLWLVAGSAALVMMAGLALAQPPAGEAPSGARQRMQQQNRFEQLGLSDQQKEQIHQTLLDTRKKNIDVEAKQKLGRIELHELMSADTPDQGKINAKITELSKLHETLMRNHVESRLAIQKVLTPEQRTKLKALRPMMMREHFRGGFRHFDGGGPGMMRRGGFGRGMGLGMFPEEPELDEEEF
jgi:Spy/CpxP family protein refolding chaperone